MGVQDRTYMRDPNRPSWGGSSSWTTRIVIACVVMFFVQRMSGNGLIDLAVSWPAIAELRVWTLLTAAFLHADVWHLVFNMFGLWIFGRMVEELVPANRVLAFYLIAALFPHVVYVVAQAVMGTGVPSIGASGMVFATILFAAIRFPKRVILIWGILPVPLWLLGIILVVTEYSGLGGQFEGGGGVNHLVHLAGGAYGALVAFTGVIPWEGRIGGGGSIRGGFGVGPTPRRPPPAASHPDRLLRGDHVQREVDRLLDKINAEGIGSLTDEEREFLRNASGGGN